MCSSDGTPAAILPDMMGLMRSVAILFAVLVIALVFTMAGDASCSECLHGCCARNGGIRHLVSAIRRAIRRMVDTFRPLALLVVAYLGEIVAGMYTPTPRAETVSLRI